ncbi:MAG: histidine phosphatase family protein, partial [Comamonadaceae bacterium]
MDLILWRHAEAEDEREGLADLDRALTARGEKQSARMAAWLDRLLPDEARIISSPALRCQQTAMALGRRFRPREQLQPGATVADVLEAAQWPEARTAMVIVGHQPVLGEVGAQLLRMDGGQCAIRKGSAWWLRTRERDGAIQTVSGDCTAHSTVW